MLDKFVIQTEDDFLSAHVTAIRPQARQQSSEAQESSRGSMRCPSSKKSKKGSSRSQATPLSEKSVAAY